MTPDSKVFGGSQRPSTDVSQVHPGYKLETAREEAGLMAKGGPAA